MQVATVAREGVEQRVHVARLGQGVERLVPGLAEMIVEGRRGAPWGEQWRCSGCKRDFLSKPANEICSWCSGGVVQQLWTERRAERETIEALRMRCAQTLVAFVVSSGHPMPVGVIELRPLAMDQLNEQVGAQVMASVVRELGRCGAYFYIQHLIVRPQWREHGVGTALLDRAIKTAQSSTEVGIPLISLSGRTNKDIDWFAKRKLKEIQPIGEQRVLVGNIVRSH